MKTKVLETDKRYLGCSFQSIEQKQFKPVKNANDFQEVRTGVICSQCKGLLCSLCVSDFLGQIDLKCHRYHDDTTPLLNGLRTYTSGNDVATDFVGHCCYIKNLRDIEMQSERKKVECQKRKRTMYSGQNVLGGAFVNPEFQLIVPTCFDSIDVVGQGKETDLPPRWHFVVDEEDAQKLDEMGIQPDTNQPRHWNFEKKLIYTYEPHVSESYKSRTLPRKFVVFIYYVQK